MDFVKNTNKTLKEEYGSELGDYNANKPYELLAESKSTTENQNKDQKEEPKKKNV
ncbi:hypothetical protein [Bacillus sp. AK128]